MPTAAPAAPEPDQEAPVREWRMKTLSFTPPARRGQRPASWSSLPIAVALGCAAFLAGCATEPESHVVSAPPPATPPAATPSPATTTTTTTATPVVTTHADGTQTTQTVVVTQAPPAPQQEVVSARPGPDYVWVAGYWRWRDSRYEWVAGHWEVPPRTGAVWIPPRWAPESGGYRFYDGYWD